jgi:hypothetical protein
MTRKYESQVPSRQKQGNWENSEPWNEVNDVLGKMVAAIVRNWPMSPHKTLWGYGVRTQM